MAFDPVDMTGEGLGEKGFEAIANFKSSAAKGAEFGLGVFVFDRVCELFEVVTEAGEFGGAVGFNGEGFLDSFLGGLTIEVGVSLNVFKEGFGGLASLIDEKAAVSVFLCGEDAMPFFAVEAAEPVFDLG